MKIEISLRLIDSQITGFELGDIALTHDEVTITSAGRKPCQSMMIFIFLSDLLDSIFELTQNKSQQAFQIIGTDSSFCLSLKKTGSDITIRNTTQTLVVPLEQFLNCLYSDVRNWLEPLRHRIDPDDAGLTGLLNALDKFKAVL